jgi:ribose-phosphate pyrophosphokinase
MGAGKIKLIMPWFSYAKQDKVFRPGEPLSAGVVINLLNNSPIDSFCILDIHSAELLKLFKKPVTHQTAMALFKKYYQRNKKICKETLTAVAVDQGSYERAQEFAKCLQVELARFSKFRDKSSGAVSFTGFDGSVEGKDLVAFDDFVNTGATLVQSAQELKQKGARSYCFCVTHVVVPSAMAKIINDPAIDMVITTNTVARDLKHPKMVVLDAAGLFRLK